MAVHGDLGMRWSTTFHQYICFSYNGIGSWRVSLLLHHYDLVQCTCSDSGLGVGFDIFVCSLPCS